jgi:folate-dependent phosphoribosylglycinamide formyltransferase PurN
VALKPLYKPGTGPMRVAGLMSGSGTNIRKILERQRQIEEREGRASFEVVVLFGDRGSSRAVEIGVEYDIPVVIRDLAAFCRQRGTSRSDLRVRERFDRETVRALSAFEAEVAAYGGYMSIATRPLVDAFLGINVHPADLSIENPDGTRKYIGDHAVRDAIAAGERTLASSTHIIEPEVDAGRILMISAPVLVVIKPQWNLEDPRDLQEAEICNQERLKEQGDWVIFPRTLEDLAKGKFAQDSQGRLYYEGEPIPKGRRLS